VVYIISTLWRCLRGDERLILPTRVEGPSTPMRFWRIWGRGVWPLVPLVHLLRRPRKVRPHLRNIFAGGTKSAQAWIAFARAEKSFRRHASLLRGPNKVCAAVTSFCATGTFVVQRLLEAWTEFRKPKLKVNFKVSSGNLKVCDKARRTDRRYGRAWR